MFVRAMRVCQRECRRSRERSKQHQRCRRCGDFSHQTKTYDQFGTISSDFAFTKTGSGGSTHIGIHGWSVSPLHEFYIIEDWIGSRPVPGTKVSSITVDGATYDVFTQTLNNQDSIIGKATFTQFSSVRQAARQCGHLDISKYMKAWASLKLILGNMAEARLFVEALGNSGSVDFTTANVVVN